MFGIFISVVLCLLFMILGGHTLKYIKEFACKIKIIVNRAEDKRMQLKDYHYQPRSVLSTNDTFNKMEALFKNEIRKSRSRHYMNIVLSYLALYDHLIYYPMRGNNN